MSALFSQSWTMQNPSRCGAGVIAIFQNLHTVYQDVGNPGSILVRSFVGGVVGDGIRVEYDDVGEIAWLDIPATLQL